MDHDAKTDQDQKLVPEPGLSTDDTLRDVVAALTGTLEDILGLEDAAPLVHAAGARIGVAVSERYRRALGQLPDDPDGIARLLVDLKARLGGRFIIERVGASDIVLTAQACPYLDRIAGKPSLCLFMAHATGRLAAAANGYARVRVDRAMAAGHASCRLTVTLDAHGEGGGDEFFD